MRADVDALNLLTFMRELATRSRGSQPVHRPGAIPRLSSVEPSKLLALFQRIEANLVRYPAIDAADFRRAVLATVNLQ